MRIAYPLLALTALVTSSASLGQNHDKRHTVIARLMHGGYVKVDNHYLPGPEGTDQVWAEWSFRSCQSGESSQTYVHRRLVHSVRFPKPGGLFLLGLGPTGDVENLSALPRGAKVVCR